MAKPGDYSGSPQAGYYSHSQAPRNLGEVTSRDRDAMRNACEPTPALPLLQGAVEAIRRKVNTLEALLDALETKLEPVTQLGSVPVEQGASGKISANTSALTAELNDLEGRLEAVCRRIDVLLGRLEL